MKYFPNDLAVEARVVTIPNDMYFFAENGDPNRRIRCHRNQAGDLRIEGGKIIFVPDAKMFPTKPELEVVIIRVDQNPESSNYTLAQYWVPLESWQDVEWITRLKRIYRAVGSDHTVNDTATKVREHTIIEGTLEDLIRSRQVYPGLGSGTYTSNLFGIKYQCKVSWEESCPDGSWKSCLDPRPKK